MGAGGIDLGSLRCDVALVFGEDAPAEVALGWEEEIGEAPSALPYWDAVSCLAAPSNLSHWLAAFHAQGRIDLTIETLTARRDAFLEAALVELR